MSHVVHYGSSVFEGIRFYNTPAGPAAFRLSDHIRRFVNSAHIYRMDLGRSKSELADACREVVNRNGLNEGYIRPVAVRGLGALGLHPGESPVETYIVCWPWGRYLGTEALEQGVDVCVSSWNRPAPNTLPTLAKAGGNYVISQLMRLEAEANGYAEAIGLGPDGLVSEGSGQNLFLVDEGVLYTPMVNGTMLNGITRDSVLKLAENLGIQTREQAIPREMLYVADELFFTGTASEITPVRSVDRIEVGGGGVGPITQTLQKEYLGIATGERPDRYGWLEPISQSAGEAVV
jgi:branched-chain amino acid aminotransferase